MRRCVSPCIFNAESSQTKDRRNPIGLRRYISSTHSSNKATLSAQELTPVGVEGGVVVEVAALLGKAALLSYELAKKCAYAYTDSDVYIASPEWERVYKDIDGESYTGCSRSKRSEGTLGCLKKSQDY